MHIDPIMPILTASVVGILLLSLLLRKLKFPMVIAYLLAGVILGPQGFGVFTDPVLLGHLGSIGALLLLFFVGMEISLPRLLSGWKVAVIGTLLQILISLLLVFALGYWLGWSPALIVLLGFVISLSSTAVVIKILQDQKEVEKGVGQDVIGILLVQDLAIIPMLVVLGLLAGVSAHPGELIIQLVSGVALILILVWIGFKQELNLPLGNITEDREMQVFAALLICFGMAFITGWVGLSTMVGAFVAGIVVSAARHTRWVHQSLAPFRVVFVALFFVSIAMLVDLDFLARTWMTVTTLVVIVVLGNTLLNALILKALGLDWREAFYGGALLSQIGEFSFVLASMGSELGIIDRFGLQLSLSVIAISLITSPFWILFVRGLTRKPPAPEASSLEAPQASS